jgi:hypothetical protein
MMLRDDALQMNLEAENDHERKALDILREHGGKATLHNGVNVQACQGGYLRDFGDNGCPAITIKQEKVMP